MAGTCIRCDREIEEVYSICKTCADDIFTEHPLVLTTSPIVGKPAIDRYREDCEGILSIGERPGSDLTFRQGKTALEEVKDYQLGDKDGEELANIFSKIDSILAEVGVLEDIEFDKYVFSKQDIKIIEDIFFKLKEIKEERLEETASSSLLMRIGNIFYYASNRSDTGLLPPDFRYEIKKDFIDEAERFYKLSIAASEENARAHHNLGDLLLNQGYHEEAIERFKRCKGADPSNKLYLQCSIALTQALIEQGEKEVDEMLERLLDEYSDVPDLWYLKGEYLRRKESASWGRSIQYYNRALEQDPEHKKSLKRKGELFLYNDRVEEALGLFSRIVELDEKDVQPHIQKARAHRDMDQWGEALKSFTEALALDPQVITAWIERADLLFEREYYEKALTSYNNALILDNDIQEAIRGKERCKENLGEQ